MSTENCSPPLDLEKIAADPANNQQKYVLDKYFPITWEKCKEAMLFAEPETEHYFVGHYHYWVRPGCVPKPPQDCRCCFSDVGYSLICTSDREKHKCSPECKKVMTARMSLDWWPNLKHLTVGSDPWRDDLLIAVVEILKEKLGREYPGYEFGFIQGNMRDNPALCVRWRKKE